VKFPYFKLPHPDPKKKFLQFPWVPVSINARDEKKTFLMLVDSGADHCIFDKDVAEFLGINIKQGQLEDTTGIGGSTDIYYFDNIWINVGGHQLNTRAGFINGLLANGKIAGVLGRQGFFEFFKVRIDEKSKEIELKPR